MINIRPFLFIDVGIVLTKYYMLTPKNKGIPIL